MYATKCNLKQPLLGNTTHRRLLGNWGCINKGGGVDGTYSRRERLNHCRI